MNSITLRPELDEIDTLYEFISDELSFEDLQVNFIAEEIFVNIVEYSKTEFIRVNANYENSTLTLEFIDNGIQFNPLLKETSDLPDNIDEAEIGGRGIFLTKEMADELDYHYENGENHLKAIKKIEQSNESIENIGQENKKESFLKKNSKILKKLKIDGVKAKLMKVFISFLVMILFTHAFESSFFFDMGLMYPDVGPLYVLGLLLGPYGVLGAVSANLLHDLLTGSSILDMLVSAIINFGVSYLAYKLWYSGFKADKVTKPRLNNLYQLNLFITSMIICALICSASYAILTELTFADGLGQFELISIFLNFTNIAFIFGIISIWISKKIDFIESPKPSKRKANKKLYDMILCLLVIVTIISSIGLLFNIDDTFTMAESILMGILLFAYLTKPFEYEIKPNDENTLIEKIIRIFLIITMSVAIIGVIVSFLSFNYVVNMDRMNIYVSLMPMLIISDIIIGLFLVPGMIILRYFEENAIKPISSFSQIERFIKENEKIEAEGLVNIYSKYINEPNEIGTLAKSYTDLIEHNNHYIENIREIEGEKERIGTELDIARKIQAANLPTEALIEDDLIVNGYSHPAKEVGGDFFDYYKLDEDNIVIVIGDAAGKGIPAAIMALIAQVTIKQILEHEIDPSTVLHHLNNQLCKNNSEDIFITLWLGIYNKPSKRLIYSNGGHNPPLIKVNDEKGEVFKYLDIDTGLVLGIMEDFDFVTEETRILNELVLYTDGITDADNASEEIYGVERLLKFFNDFKEDSDPIRPLLNDIRNFTEGQEQFDDMTILYLKDKHA